MKIIELLELRGLVDTAHTKFVRHQVTGVDLTELMILGYLDRYQRVQARPVFKDCRFIVSFIGLTQSRARFLGVYRVNGVRLVKDEPAPEGYPLLEKPNYYYYDLEKIDNYANRSDQCNGNQEERYILRLSSDDNRGCKAHGDSKDGELRCIPSNRHGRSCSSN